MELQKALYMLPVPITEEGKIEDFLPLEVIKLVPGFRFFIVENLRTARRILKKINPAFNFDEVSFYELNGHTPEEAIDSFLNPLREGVPMAVMSEAGCPGVADPGAKVVEIAQKEGLRVIPLVGPSSILLSLMASGLDGQNFSFHGYLPVKDPDKDRMIRLLEQESRKNDATQIFIETPYRNMKMLESLLKNLSEDTKLCIASEVTNPNKESIMTKTVAQWRQNKVNLEKVPTIFLFHSGGSRRKVK